MSVQEIRERQRAVDALQVKARSAMVEWIVETLDDYEGHIDISEEEDEIIKGREFDEIDTLNSMGKTTFMMDGIPEYAFSYEEVMAIFNYLVEHFS